MSISKLAAAANGGWADLPRDLLETILARLPVPDHLRFPAVCTTWQSATSSVAGARPRHAAPPLSPWLMPPFNPTSYRLSGDAAKLLDARFLSLAEGITGKTYTIRQPSPAISDRVCIGSSPDGWLITADASSELHLLNPLTGVQLSLPPAATLPLVDAIHDASGHVVSYTYNYSLECCCSCFAGGGEALLLSPEMMTIATDMLRYEVYEKAILVSPPRQLAPSGEWGGYAVVLICNPLSRLVIARAGDTEWAPLDDKPGRRCWVDAVPAAAFTGAEDDDGERQVVVYAMDTAGRVEAWDVGTTSPATNTPSSSSRAVAPPCRCSAPACAATSAACRKYLVELAPGGHLLQVHRVRDAAHARYSWEPRPERVEYTTTGIELFEWTPTAGGGEWVQVDGKGVLRVRALFLGKNASLCVPVEDDGGGWPEVRGNCVYFTDDGPWSDERCHEVAPDVGVMDLADGSYRPPRGAAREMVWKWPPPVWVFPSLATN
ncbi:hypothetical protein HU200_043258 [Digitaria exilis]|uniref:F-box domain-containing protein n=1 Tax=Digitaria exilis TaxID=1010633 RepID=A0A835BBI5_9POAL|nr:hypothetical protein HU200_043258 [Digitaria exilis]